MRVQWGGAPVPPRTRVLWKIRLWDENGEPGEWSEAHFETGLPKGEPWQAKWISGEYTPKKKGRYPVDCFRKTFPAKGIKKARLYITACGLYEAQLNEQRVGPFVLAPGHTDYRKRVQYQTYDVTELLREGETLLTVQLADGWYRGSCGAWGLLNQYGTQTKLLAQLEMTGEDGRVTTLRTGESWQWSNDGPIRFTDNQDGEVVDARMTPSYSGRARAVSHDVIPTASNNVPVTEHESFSPTVITTPSGKTVLDFGQNIAGYVSFSLTAKAGQKLKLRFGELLDKDGEFTQKNIQCSNKKKTTPLQQVEYICKGGRNDYKTTFAIFGFQYVLVESDFAIDPADFTAIAVYSDLERTGWFESSNQLLNQFFDCTLWSAKNNHADLPTDCPTRERHGWTGDAQIFCPTASYLFDYMAFAEKYLNDLYDWQKPSGCLPQIAPEGGTDYQALIRQPGFALDTNRQARLVRPLYMELLDKDQASYARERLVKVLDDYRWRLGTGFLSTPLILDVLTDLDIAYAYRLLENEEIPGWLSMPKNGATTIWEGWEGPNAQEGIASLDHYSKGAVCRWLFDTMCGIRVAGEDRFAIVPRPGGHFTHARAAYVSVYGRVESGWQKTDAGIEFTVTIPANCTARVALPDGSEREQGAGSQTYLISEG